MLESFVRGPSGPLGSSDSPDSPSPNICAVVVGTEFGGHAPVRSTMADQDSRTSRTAGGRGFLLTGSEDRYWDLSRIERSAVLTGMELDSDKPTYR